MAQMRLPRASPANLLLGAVFALAAALRVALCLVNTEANDDHMTPIRMLAESWRPPARGECPECFQPKLFYAAGAVLLKVLRLREGRAATLAVQAMNCAAGIGTLWIVLLFARGLTTDPVRRLLVFSTAALNPYLIAVSAQASNDAFVVLFSTLALYFLFQFLGDGQDRRRRALLITLCTALAGLSKGNGLLVFAGIAVLLTAKIWSDGRSSRTRRFDAAFLTAFVLAFLLVVPYFGQYVRNYRTSGSPFATNQERDAPPFFFEETFPPRPGITSVARSYFTFPLVDLLARPRINTSDMLCIAGDASACSEARAPESDPEAVRAPEHQTSFWALLYGSAHSVDYYQWPRSWRTRAPALVALTRTIFVLALVPTALLLAGLIAILAALARSLGRGGGVPDAPRAAAAAFAGGFVAWLIAYSLSYRDFSTVKAIYLFPGLLAYVAVFDAGWGACAANPRTRARLAAALAALCALYALEVACLVARLAA
jgi:hypothetical protein